MIDLKNFNYKDAVKIIEKIEGIEILRVEDSIVSIFNGIHLFVGLDRDKDLEAVEVFGVIDIPSEVSIDKIPEFINSINDISAVTRFRFSQQNKVIYLQANLLAYGMVDEEFFTRFIKTCFKEALKAESYLTIINEIVNIGEA